MKFFLFCVALGIGVYAVLTLAAGSPERFAIAF